MSRIAEHVGVPVRFPDDLWPEAEDGAIARQLADAFPDCPLLLTDGLANVVYLSPEAERLMGDRAEALVNRLSLSLLGFGNNDRYPPGLVEALRGEREPWKGLVNISSVVHEGDWRVAEASAARRGDRLVCGMIRIGREQAIHNPAT